MYVSVNGARLFFDVDGQLLFPAGPAMRQKPTIVMVHGGPGGDHSVAKPYFAQFTDIAQVVYYDQRGNGRSDLCDSTSWNLDQWSKDLKAFCDALEIEKPIVVGTSFGGFVTLAYATKYPNHAGAIILISTAAKVDFRDIYEAFERQGGTEIRRIAESYWENPTDAARALYRERCVPFYSYRKDVSTDWLSRVMWRNETALWFNGPKNEHGRFDYRSKLNTIPCSVLVMVGEEDPITPPAFSDAIVAGLPSDQVTYLKFQECGHGVVADKPKKAAAAIRNFILNNADG
ncbi:MAG: alpha/beta hydrolase [Pseudomonadota bacterium]